MQIIVAPVLHAHYIPDLLANHANVLFPHPLCLGRLLLLVQVLSQLLHSRAGEYTEHGTLVVVELCGELDDVNRARSGEYLLAAAGRIA